MPWLLLFLLVPVHATLVIQFVVYSPDEATVTRLFPGAQVEFTWNNVFIVTIWAQRSEDAIREINSVLAANKETLQVIIPPFPVEEATRKWIEYNLAWVCVLLVVFMAGCTCGGCIIKQLANIRRASPATRCPTTYSRIL